MIKTLAFDLGGVIVDFTHRSITQKFSDISGLSDSEIFDFIFNSGIEKLYDTGKISTAEFYEKVKTFLKTGMSFEEFRKIWTEIFYEKPEISLLIKQLSLHNNLVLISNTNDLHFPYCYENFPVLKYFNQFFLSYKMGIRKPSELIFRRVIEELGIGAGEILFIDDIEEYGGTYLNGSCSNKLSNRIQELLLRENTPRKQYLYSKRIHGVGMLARLSPENVAERCRRYFAPVYRTLLALR